MIYVFIVFAILIIGFIFLIKKVKKPGKDMRALCEKAIWDAKENHDVILDKSIESLEAVDRIIQKLHEQESNNSDDISMLYGSYIGEVIIGQVEHGFWNKNLPQDEKHCYSICINQKSYIYPTAWVEKHLSHGKEDGILFKCQSTLNKHRS